ncbi:hypothetical protein [Variovorax sp. CY25R-8]|uniref:hypothetical protein n=1 Tax=Variovorax sp. CY25R-8 TaxID=2855501 RepID=UPI0021BA727D|nr:hypothetical protein [Variovorax sp. CY25R-8]MCT8175275.1 hypothetical protein [Variovorax sp. CY25R-8]
MAMDARRWIGRHAVALLLAATWATLAGLLALGLERADRDARFLYLVETQVCHVPGAVQPLALSSAATVADPRKASR